MKKVSVTLLTAIVAAGVNGTFADLKSLTELVNGNFVEVNHAMTNDNGQVAVRATEAGIAEINGKSAGGEKTSIPGIALASVVIPIPEKVRGAGAGRESKYPFDKMEVNQSFFVAETSEQAQEDLFKSLGSTASSANRRFATKTGVMEEKRGKQVEKLEYTRNFEVRRVADGAAWGDQYKGVKGVGCWRTA